MSAPMVTFSGSSGSRDALAFVTTDVKGKDAFSWSVLYQSFDPKYCCFCYMASKRQNAGHFKLIKRNYSAQSIIQLKV